VPEAAGNEHIGHMRGKQKLTTEHKVPYYICLTTEEQHGLRIKIKTTLRVKSSTVMTLRSKMMKKDTVVKIKEEDQIYKNLDCLTNP